MKFKKKNKKIENDDFRKNFKLEKIPDDLDVHDLLHPQMMWDRRKHPLNKILVKVSEEEYLKNYEHKELPDDLDEHDSMHPEMIWIRRESEYTKRYKDLHLLK